jgi:hypothetical protein
VPTLILARPVGAPGAERRRTLGALTNVALRLGLAYFLFEVLLKPDDPRFAGKAIPVRNLVVVGGLSLLFPGLHLLRRRRREYPWWTDDLFLSIFWLDMAGNSFDLYDRYYYFDMLPHAHGTGAAAVVFARGLGLRPLGAGALANGVHVLLEVQEYLTDVFFGTRNVRGASDTARDLLAGLAGAAVYLWLHERIGRRGGRRPAGRGRGEG